MAGYVRMTRAYVLESLSEDYVRTARAKGLPKRTVTYKHALRAALTPIVTMAGLDFAGLMGGAIITESVFNYPGHGQAGGRGQQRLRPADPGRPGAAAGRRSSSSPTSSSTCCTPSSTRACGSS